MNRDGQIFADSIGAIGITGSVVRIDFVTLSPAQDAMGSPKMVFSHRVVMPLDGFLAAAGKMQQAAQALTRRGGAKAEPRLAQPRPKVASEAQQAAIAGDTAVARPEPAAEPQKTDPGSAPAVDLFP